MVEFVNKLAIASVATEAVASNGRRMGDVLMVERKRCKSSGF